MGKQGIKQFLTFKKIKKCYNKIEYKATTDKKWYPLKDYFPICIPVDKDKYSAYLDTGGEMSNGYFDVYKFTKSGLYKDREKITDIRFVK